MCRRPSCGGTRRTMSPGDGPGRARDFAWCGVGGAPPGDCRCFPELCHATTNTPRHGVCVCAGAVGNPGACAWLACSGTCSSSSAWAQQQHAPPAPSPHPCARRPLQRTAWRPSKKVQPAWSRDFVDKAALLRRRGSQRVELEKYKYIEVSSLCQHTQPRAGPLTDGRLQCLCAL